MTLHNRHRLTSRRMDLMSSHTPVLTLTDALGDKGFEGVSRVVRHRVGVLGYDNRCLSGRRAYLQCVLRTRDLATKGIGEFSSVGSGAYFDALLRGKGAVRPGLSAAAYKRLLATETGDELAVVALEVEAPLPLPGPARRAAHRQVVPRPPPPHWQMKAIPVGSPLLAAGSQAVHRRSAHKRAVVPLWETTARAPAPQGQQQARQRAQSQQNRHRLPARGACQTASPRRSLGAAFNSFPAG